MADTNEPTMTSADEEVFFLERLGEGLGEQLDGLSELTLLATDITAEQSLRDDANEAAKARRSRLLPVVIKLGLASDIPYQQAILTGLILEEGFYPEHTSDEKRALVADTAALQIDETSTNLDRKLQTVAAFLISE